MGRLINKTQQGYTNINNNILRDNNLNLKERGMLITLISLPDSWEFSISGLSKIVPDGKDAIRSAINRLEELGYVNRIQAKNDKGQWDGYDWQVFDEPTTDAPMSEKPMTENPTTDNPTQLITNKSITNKSIKKELNTNKDKYIVICDYLNLKAGTKFKPSSKATQQHINARLDEGFTADDFKSVIDKKCADWLGTEWSQYLRPATLFGTKFESYLNAPTNKKKIGATGIEVMKPEVDDLKGIL